MNDPAEGARTKQLTQVAGLATSVADRILDAQIAGRPIPPEQLTSLVGAARLLQDHGMDWPPLVEPEPPAVEPRRILPNLIDLELEPIKVEAAKPYRQRTPRKASRVAAEPVAAPAAPVAPAAASPHVSVSPRPPVRLARPWTILPPGQRWKRRLPRWAR